MLVVVLVYIGIELFQTQGLKAQFQELAFTIPLWHPVYIVLILLMPLNWTLEAIKWKALLKPVMKVSLGAAIKGVLTGVALGFVTPHSLGDYVGRIGQLQAQNRLESVGAILLGRGAQFLATLGFGLFGMGLWYYLDSGGLAAWIFPSTVLALSLMAGSFFMARKSFVSFCGRVWPASKRYMDVMRHYSAMEVASIIGYSILRYLVFAFQFTFLLYWLEVPLPLFTLWCGVTWVFLAKSVLPAFNFLSDLGVREFSALYFFGMFTIPIAPILAASLAVWSLNILLPALVGALFINQMKLFRS